MPRDHTFNREEVFPSWFPNRLQDFLSGCRTEFNLQLIGTNAVGVVPTTLSEGICSVCVMGLWRFRETIVERAHPGGVGGTYHIWAVATKSEIDNTPDPFTDHTDYSFDLRITAAGVEPSGAGVDVYEKVGECTWSGTEITSLTQTLGTVSGAQLASGALSGEGDINWFRQPSGAWRPELKSDSVITEVLANLAVTTAKVAVGAIIAEKLGSESVETAKIKALAVTAAKLAVESVTSSKLGPESVTNEKIINLAITAAKLAFEAVTTEKVANLAITAAKVAANAIEESKILDGAVTSRKLKLTSGIVSATEDLILGTSFANVPGAILEVTPAVASYLYVSAIFNLNLDAAGQAGTNINGTISVDGVDQEDNCSWGQGGATTIWISLTLPMFYRVPLTAAKHTIRMRGKKGVPASNASISVFSTGFMWFLGSQ